MFEEPPIGLMLVPTPLLAGVVGGVVVGLLSGSWIVAIIAVVGVALIAAASAYVMAERVALALMGARPLGDGGSQMLRNQLEELCARTGVPEPEIYTVGPGAPAIASVGTSNEIALVVTDGLSDELTVVELEAAVARELAKTKSGSTTVDTLAVTFLTVPLGWIAGLGHGLLRWLRGTDHDAKADLDGVAITRYPPGMCAALSKMHRPAGIKDSVGHLWATGDVEASETGRFSLQDRLEMLQEL